MIKQVIIDEHDIIRVVADAFDVKTEDVDMNVYRDSEGYGMDEHYVYRVEATVTLPADKKMD